MAVVDREQKHPEKHPPISSASMFASASSSCKQGSTRQLQGREAGHLHHLDSCMSPAQKQDVAHFEGSAGLVRSMGSCEQATPKPLSQL